MEENEGKKTEKRLIYTFQVPPELEGDIEKIEEKGGYASRSEVIRDLLRIGVRMKKTEQNCVGVAV